ncbi:MAG: acetylxylan esterase [Chloroflexi bacterium]|nr:acetylxylan esterase [Chloroflexota bacterium]
MSGERHCGGFEMTDDGRPTTDDRQQTTADRGRWSAVGGRHVLRLTIFAAVTLVAALAALDVGLAWIFVSGMTHPGCRQPQLVAGLPAPETHWLPTQDGLALRVWYYPSQNGAAILVFGGLTGSLGDSLPPVIPLIRAGYGVLQIDSRACANPPAPVTLGGNEIYDAGAALEFLLSRPEVDSERIGAIGFSMGGATALRAAAANPQIRTVVRDGGFSNLGELLSPAESASIPQLIFQSTVLAIYQYQTGVDPWAVDPIGDLPAISPRPVLLIFGEHEAASGREQFEAAREPKELWIVPGGTHGRNQIVAPEEYERRVFEFFEGEMGGW